MISLTLFKANFDELNINHLSKRALLDSLKVFYKGSDFGYLELLEHLGIDYYKKFNNIFELNSELNKEIKIFNTFASQEQVSEFDFKAVSLLRRSLKEITDNDYYKLNLDLRHINDSSTITKIKDIFLFVNSLSLVDFKEVEEQRLSLIYNKRGASIYQNDFVLSNARDNISLVENFKEAKDNNFIVARFLLELSKELKKANINESFSYSYDTSTGKKEMIKSLDEILHWGSLSKEEKEEQKAREKEKQELSQKALSLAKAELKEQGNASRNSLPKESSSTLLDEQKSLPKLDNIKSIQKEQELKSPSTKKNTATHSKDDTPKQITKEDIEKTINESFELYHQKEMEKTELRLQKAQKESFNAYEDLKANLNDGLSIVEALKFIQQKYRNEDTINFASLLFSKDILNVKAKEEEIKALNNELNEAYDKQELLNDELTKREETISKLKGTMQSKINEITALRLEFEEEITALKETELKFKELEKYSNEQDKTINELDNENEELNNKFKALSEEKIRLDTQNAFLQNTLNEYKQKELSLDKEFQRLKELEKQTIKFELENTNLKVKTQDYEAQINELKSSLKDEFKKELEFQKLVAENEYLKSSLKEFNTKEAEYKQIIAKLENKMQDFVEQVLYTQEKQNRAKDETSQEAKTRKNLRSRDILGD